MMGTHPFGTAANRYARDVVRGKIAACASVRQACGRHLDDLERSKAKDYPFRWDRCFSGVESSEANSPKAM